MVRMRELKELEDKENLPKGGHNGNPKTHGKSTTSLPFPSFAG